MSNKKPLLIEPQYLPSIPWVLTVMHSENIYIDVKEHYVKGTYRNRCHILGPNGLQRLSIPLEKGKHQHSSLENVRISYENHWQKDHWLSLCSAYRSSAYFEYFEDVFYPFYHKKTELLLEFNLALISCIFKLLDISKTFQFTETYISKGTTEYEDMRSVISPKKEFLSAFKIADYHQVFSDRFTFEKDLSIFDFICNQGKNIMLL